MPPAWRTPAHLHATVVCLVLDFAAPDGQSVVSASGAPTLAVAGSGDVLSGVAGTLLAQTGDALASGACAAWVHGRAGELASEARGGRTRGVVLDEVVAALGGAWPHEPIAALAPVLCELPAVGEGRGSA